MSTFRLLRTQALGDQNTSSNWCLCCIVGLFLSALGEEPWRSCAVQREQVYVYEAVFCADSMWDLWPGPCRADSSQVGPLRNCQGTCKPRLSACRGRPPFEVPPAWYHVSCLNSAVRLSRLRIRVP